jgi:glycosyltransferase involved in cell wall biosynthesis
MNKEIKFSLVVPCFNEYGSLCNLLPEIHKMISASNFEIIFVNNGSTDQTKELLDQFQTDRLRVLHLKSNQGYGGGIKMGLNECVGDYLGWVHADLQYSIPEIITNIQTNAGLNSFVKGRRQGRTLVDQFISLNFSVFASLLFHHRLFDINAQPTFFHKSFISNFDSLPNDFSIDLFVYVLAKKKRLKICKFNVKFEARRIGNSSWNSGLKSILSMSIRTVKFSLKLRVNRAIN